MNAEEICNVCGLPREICVCDDIAYEQQHIHVRIDSRRYGKEVTILSGLDSHDIDLKSLSKILKTNLACGGSIKDGEIVLQGDHRQLIRQVLVENGFESYNIVID
jgi:translation initiation factor 1